MSNQYEFIDNDLIPDCDLEIQFEKLQTKVSRNNVPYLLVVMKVRNDISENGPFKDRILYDSVYKEKNSEVFTRWKMEALIKTQDISKLVDPKTKRIDMSLEQIIVFLTGKNARIHIAIEHSENYGVRNVIKKYMKTQYIPKEVEEELNIDYDDLPF